MNFFKSVFSSDPDPSDSSSEEKSAPESPHKPQRNDEEEEDERPAATEYDPNHNNNHNLNTNTPWVGLGTLIKTFATKSESVIQTYRRDLEEFSSGLKKETEAIREVATRAVRDLPSALEVGASAAQESLETVGQAIDDFGGSVWRGTAEIISEGKSALLAPDSDSETYSSDHQPSGGITASSSKRYSRFELQVLAMQSDLNTFSEEPEDDEEFRKWMSEFRLEEKEEEIELLCYDNGTVEDFLEKLVPSVMDYDTFWSRYFYKLDKLKHAEDVRANLVKRVIAREDEDEDLTWEVDDDEEEGNQAKVTDTNDNPEMNEGIREEEQLSVEYPNDNPEMNEGIREEEQLSVENEVESKGGHAEESKEKGDENEEASNSEHAKDSDEKGDTDNIELAQEKKPGEEPEDLRLDVTTTVDNEMVASSTGGVDDTEQGSNLLITKSGDNVPPKSASETVESFKDSDVSIVSSQASVLEEEDLGWDEIEDLAEHDDKKVGGSNSTRDEKDLHKRLNVGEDDDDLTWDIEDDD